MSLVHPRRSFLETLVGGCVLGTAGCLRSAKSVSVLAAGSLSVVLDEHVGRQFQEETRITYYGEYYGANAVMRMVESEQKRPDVVVSSDDALLRDRLYVTFTDWDVAFASNSIGLAYAPDTQIGERLENGEPWYEVVGDADHGEIAIGDPNLDPLGYRAMLAFALAAAEHDRPDFVDSLAQRVYREPDEPQLLASIEAGNRAAAVVYHNMALDHGLPFYEFPDTYNFSNPAYTDHYADVSYSTSNGYSVRGAPIVYNATVLNSGDNHDAGREFVRFLSETGGVLQEHGLRINGFPRAHGDVPDGVIVG